MRRGRKKGKWEKIRIEDKEKKCDAIVDSNYDIKKIKIGNIKSTILYNIGDNNNDNS